MPLRFEQLQPSTGQAGFQTRRPQLTVAVLAVVVESVDESDHRPVHQDVAEKLLGEGQAQKIEGRAYFRRRAIEALDDGVIEDDLEQGASDGGGRVQGQTAAPVARRQWVAASQRRGDQPQQNLTAPYAQAVAESAPPTIGAVIRVRQ